LRLRFCGLAALAALGVSLAFAVEARADVTPPASFPASGILLQARVVARARPNPSAARVLTLYQFRLKDAKRQIVLALAKATGTDGRLWYKLSLPMRPNGTRGWVPASTVDVTPVHKRIVVHRGLRRLVVLRNGVRIFRTNVAVGMPSAPTPLGHNFYVTLRFRPSDSFLGAFAFETSAYSSLTEWPGGGVVGIHGTTLPDLLGQAVSHGCVRVSNSAALRLKELVPLGTPVDIVRR
jgi:lipoprotein-anchoring transpeptidase ErfK/SrfK